VTTPPPNPPEPLRREILEEARRQQEEILRQARHQAEAVVAKAEMEAEQFRKERLEAAAAEAKRRTEAILATVPVETGRMRSAGIEELLQAIHNRAREHLQARIGFDYRETIARLSAVALQQMAGASFRLRLSASHDRVLGDGLAEAIQTCCGSSTPTLRLIADSNLKDGDVLIEDEGGRQIWNLSLDARLERCWPELRHQIAAQAGFMPQGTS
jgi:vacuolar-type H+-ATPase subunit E/Vma4